MGFILNLIFMVEPPILEAQEERLGGIQLIKNHFQLSYRILKNDTRIMKIIVFYSLVFAAHTLLFFYSQQYYFDGNRYLCGKLDSII